MITPTKDAEFIERCVTHPDIWRATADDMCGDPNLYFFKDDGRTLWLRAGDDGVFMLHPHNSIMYECHTMLLPVAWGRAAAIAKEAIDWMWDNTNIIRLITNVPAFNVLALRMAKKVGFVQYGVNPRSFLKNEILHDQIMLGMDRR